MWQKAKREECETWWHWLRKKWNEVLISKIVPTDQTPMPNTHNLAIDHRLSITANPSPKHPFDRQTTTSKPNYMLTDPTASTSATTSSSSHASLSSTVLSNHTRSSATTRCYANSSSSMNALSNQVHDQKQLIEFLAATIAKEKRQMPLLVNLGAQVFRGADVIVFIEAHESL